MSFEKKVKFDTDNDLKTTWYLRDDAGNILTSKQGIDIINLVSRCEMEHNTLIVEATEKGLKEGLQKGTRTRN